MADIHAKLQEEKILRSIRAKRRFRSAVRHVIHNLSWLQDDDEDAAIDPTNVKQTVTRLTRKKKASKGLSIREKAVLRKHLSYRTEEEKLYLNKYIGGLKCFRRYPENVQLELVGVTYFEYYGEGRVLVKQNQEAHAMYFLLSGNVIISRTQWDEITNQYQEVELGQIFAGSMFGEVSLLHNVLRTATVTTGAPCELLVLRKEDFDLVLKESLMQRWDEIRESMTKFVYFDHWDNVAIRECCILSKIKTYLPNQIVYGDGKTRKGSPVTTYFLIEGTCAVVEHLFIEETVKRGIKYYKLYTPPEPPEPEAPVAYSYAQRIEDDRIEELEEKINDTLKNEEKDEEKFNELTEDKLQSVVDMEKSLETAQEIRESMKSLPRFQSQNEIYEVAPDVRRSDKMSIMAYKSLLQKELLACMLPPLHKKLPPNVKVRFMQICTLGETAVFFQGDLMKNRRVIALTPVRFLLVPSYWLSQHNKGNVWTRVEHFLKTRIPSRQTVFKKYVSNKKWQDYKRNLRDEILSQRRFYNNTTIHDVPYSVRVISNYE